MTFTDLPAEEKRVCGLVREETLHRMQGAQPFGLFLVGSRATGGAHASSDFDFVIDAGGPLPGRVINPLREALDHLRVPYMIDLVDWHRCSAAFRDLAGEQRVEIIAPSAGA